MHVCAVMSDYTLITTCSACLERTRGSSPSSIIWQWLKGCCSVWVMVTVVHAVSSGLSGREMSNQSPSFTLCTLIVCSQSPDTFYITLFGSRDLFSLPIWGSARTIWWRTPNLGGEHPIYILGVLTPQKLANTFPNEKILCKNNQPAW